MKLRTVIVAVIFAMIGALVLPAGHAFAHPASSPPPSAGELPSAVPSAITPNVDNGTVQAVAQVGNSMVIGGDFTSIGGVSRNRLAVINATTGALSTTFNPAPNAIVKALLPGPNDHTVYVGGQFTQIAGTSAQFLAELDVDTGAIVSTFKAPAFDYGMVNDLAKVGNRLYIAGFFEHLGGFTHDGLASVNATTGALDAFMGVQLTGHHNQSGSGAQGYVGPWSFDVSPDGSKMVAVGNFKDADGLLRDQIVMVDLTGAAAQVDPGWATSRYSPLCYSWAFDGQIRGITFSPDGSYFVVNATGGGNPGTLCDATTRWDTDVTGPDVQPTWVDETGGDTVWGVTITDDAVYIGGHNRWNNNPYGVDRAQSGAVPRPGLAALDPVSGRPYTWNPGHNPLGRAVYALLATPAGLWMGYDDNYIGNYQYKRQKIAFFPYAGGSTVASVSTAQLPANVYLTGGRPGLGGADSVSSIAFNGTTASPPQSPSNGGIQWSNVRGATLIGNKLFYGWTDGYLYSRTFDDGSFGPAVKIDPYHDPVWDGVDTHDGTTFDGALPSFYGQIQNVTSMFYASGRLYYTLSGDSALHWRWFSPDSGIVDGVTDNSEPPNAFKAPSSVNFSNADGMFVSGSTLYYATKLDANLHKVAFSNGAVTGSSTVVSGPLIDGINWSNRGMFLAAGNQPPTASFTSQVNNLDVTFDGTSSSDPDGTIASYAWDFGDGATATGATASHSYADAGPYTVTLTVTDNKNATGSVSHQVTATEPPPNQSPTAAFTPQCSGLGCAFDGSGSSDPDGTIASYTWDFGDSSSGSGATPSHTYAAGGQYTVKLTVVDNDGASGTVSHTVTVSSTSNAVTFVGAAHAAVNASTFKQATVPSGTSVGDTMLLFFTQGNTAAWTGPTGITGWTKVDSFTNATITSTLWQKTVVAGDLGATVRMNDTTAQKAGLTLVVYDGADAGGLVAAHVGDSAATNHVTPTLTAGAGDWVVSYWTDKSDGIAGWTAPTGVVSRDTAVGAGSGSYDSLLADSGGPVLAGPYGGLTATTNVATNKSAMWTVDLPAA